MNRWILMLLVTGMLWAGYRGYVRVVGPLTKPGPGELLEVPKAASMELPTNPVNFAAADRHLKTAPWAAEAPIKIQFGDDAFVYFNEEELDGERVELRPFAMVKLSTKRSKEPPYVVQCAGAHLTFERPYQIGGENPGRIVTAALHGKFTITGPNGLQIHGTDCWFTEDAHQLYSDQPIAFSYAPTEGSLKKVQGSADKLQIDFEPTTYAAHGKDMPRVGDVQSVTLRRNVKLAFDVEQDGEIVTNRVTSRGPFTFDFPQQLATFQDQVAVTRPTRHADGQPGRDELQAEWLAIQFDDPNLAGGLSGGGRGGKPAAADDDTEDDPSPLGRLKLKLVRAVGKTPQAPVQVSSTAAHFTGVMQDLLYDVGQRTLLLRDPTDTIELQNDDIKLRTPSLRLTHDDHRELTSVSAEREGRLDYERPGAEGEPPQRFHALWNRSMSLVPDEARGLIVVVLEGDARVIQPAPEGQLGLLCDRLTLDVDSGRAKQARLGRASTGADSPAGTGQANPLKHALAEGLGSGRVAMAGPQFEVETARLDVTFEPGTLPKGPTGVPSQSAAHVSVLPAVRRTVSPPGRPPRIRHEVAYASVPVEALPDALALAPGGGSPLKLSGDGKWKVKAESIQALVWQDPDTHRFELREVIGERNVDIQQLPQPPSSLTRDAAAPPAPLVVTGERLNLVNSGGLDQVLHLTGSPAALNQGSVHIDGDELFFDREANTAEVLGKGMMKSPVPQSLGGGSHTGPSELTIYWLRKMTFDGSIARFIEGVSTRLDDSVVRCDEMVVTLNRRIDFSASRPETEGLAIRTVKCLRGVEFQYIQWSEAAASEALVRADGKAGEFELQYDTGEFVASGGGRLKVYQKTENNRVDVDPQPAAAANQPASASTLPWQMTEVAFQDRISGNMHAKRATLFDRVEVLHAPVEWALQPFTRDDLSQSTTSAKNAIWLGSDELTISLHPWAGGEREDFVQVQAVGRRKPVELEGRLFQATAETLTYDESTKLFTLRSLGKNLVSVSMQDRPGAPYNDFTGQMIQFNPAKRSGSFQGARGAFGSR